MIKTNFSNLKYHIAVISKLKHPKATFHVTMWQSFLISEHEDLYFKLKKKNINTDKERNKPPKKKVYIS